MNLFAVRRPGAPALNPSILATARKRAVALALIATIPAIVLPSAARSRPPTSVPTVSLGSFPAPLTTSTSASFAWTTTGGSISAECTLDGVAALCDSPREYSDLAVGSHTFGLTVTNASGSASVSYTWTITKPPLPPPPPGGSLLWTGDVEEGGLMDWYAPSKTATGNYGGGEYDSGSGITTVTGTMAHSGAYSQRMSLITGVGGTRMFRWRELRANRTTRQSTWMYIPRNYTLTGNPATGKYWILFEFKSRLADGSNNWPFWYVNAYNRSDGSLGAKLSWGYQAKLEGPHAGETGWRNYGDVAIPVGRWFQISSTITQSKDFDGAIDVTVDEQLLASLTNVRTGQPNATDNAWCVEQHWAVTNYRDGIAQTPAEIYTDDAEVALP
jgi:hypothetical protein